MSTDYSKMARTQHKGGVTKRECAAMRLLARDGWSVGELRLTFQLSSRRSVYRHVTGRCAHSHSVAALAESWDGETPPSKLSADDRI